MTATNQLSTTDLQERAHRHLLMHFTRNGAFGPGGKPLLVLERGEGAYVFDTDGKRYFDGLSSLFCAQIGYSFGEEMAAAAVGQLTKLAFNTNWATAHPPAIDLAEAIAERAPGDLNRVFFTNGGSEVGRGGLEDRAPALRGQGRAGAHEGDRARDRLPRRHARGALVHRRAVDEGAVRPVADPGRAREQHEPLPRRGRRRPGRDARGCWRRWSARSSRRGRRPWRWSSPSRCRTPAAASSRRTATGPGCASCATATGSRWWPTRSSPASGASASGSPLRTSAPRRT